MPNNKKKDGFIMQAGILASAGIIVRIIGLLYNRPLVEIIGDEGNGYYNSAYYAYSIVLLISSYSIPSAISKVIAQRLATKEYRNAHRIFKCALIYALVVGCIASLFVFFGAGLMVEMQSSILPLRVLAPAIILSGILGVFRGYFQAHKTMVQTSVSQILEQLANAGVSIGMAYVLVDAAVKSGGGSSRRASYGAAGGTIGTVAGVLVGLLFMLGMYGLNRKLILKRVARDTSHQEESYQDIFKMIFMVVTPFILSTAIYNVNNFLDNYLYQRVMMNVKEVAEATVAVNLSAISKANKIVNIPIAMASAMAAALIPGISSDFARGDKESARDEVAKAIKTTMLISIPAAVGIGVLSKPITMVIFPQQESLQISSILLSLLAVSVILFALSTLTQAVLQGIGRMNSPLINASLALVIHTVVMVVCLFLLEEKYSLFIYVLSTILYVLLMCILNNVSVRKHLGYRQEFDKTFLRPFLASLLMGAVAFGVYHGMYYLCHINLISLGVAVLAGCIVYFFTTLWMGTVTEEELRSLPKGHLLVKLARKTKSLDRVKKKKISRKNKIYRPKAKEEDYWLDE